MKVCSKIILIVFVMLLALYSESQAEEGSIAVDTGETRLPGAPQQEWLYDNGFFFRSADENFKLQITGAIEPQFFYESEKKPINKTIIGPSPTERKDKMSFAVNYGLMYFGATVYDKVNFGVGFLTCTDCDDNLKVIGGNAGLSVAKELYFSAGMTGLPFDMASAMSGTGKFLSDWPATTTREDGIEKIDVTRPSFGPAGGLGIRADGSWSKLYYGLGLLNGNEDGTVLNPNKKFSFGGNLGVKIFGDSVPANQSDLEHSEKPVWVINAGGMYRTSRISTYEDANENKINVANITYMLSSTFGTAFRYKGFSLTTEGYWRKIKIKEYYIPVRDPRTSFTDIGYYAAIGYFIIPKQFEIGLQGSQIIRQGPDNNVDQFGGGLNWYIWDTHLKLQLSYIWTRDYDDIWGSDSNDIHKGTLVFSAAF